MLYSVWCFRTDKTEWQHDILTSQRECVCMCERMLVHICVCECVWVCNLIVYLNNLSAPTREDDEPKRQLSVQQLSAFLLLLLLLLLLMFVLPPLTSFNLSVCHGGLSNWNWIRRRHVPRISLEFACALSSLRLSNLRVKCEALHD